jgi:hypothetical protein
VTKGYFLHQLQPKVAAQLSNSPKVNASLGVSLRGQIFCWHQPQVVHLTYYTYYTEAACVMRSHQHGNAKATSTVHLVFVLLRTPDPLSPSLPRTPRGTVITLPTPNPFPQMVQQQGQAVAHSHWHIVLVEVVGQQRQACCAGLAATNTRKRWQRQERSIQEGTPECHACRTDINAAVWELVMHP